QLYDLFLKRLSETSATGDLASARARIVQHAVVPRLPAEPNKRRIVSVAVLLTLLFGVGVAFLLASLDNTVKSSRDVEEKLKRPLLGIEPRLANQALSAASMLGKGDEAGETDPRFAERLRTIRTAIWPVSDAAVLSQEADCVLYVVKSDATKVPQIKTGLGLLERVNAPILGVVLTQFDVRKAERYGDYDYGSYYEPDAAKS